MIITPLLSLSGFAGRKSLCGAPAAVSEEAAPPCIGDLCYLGVLVTTVVRSGLRCLGAGKERVDSGWIVGM